MATDHLSDRKIADAPRRARPYKLADGRGLFVLVQPEGSKLWRLKFRLDGKERLMSLGSFPDVKVKAARAAREAARALVAAGADPVQQRRAERAAKDADNADLFADVAADYFARHANPWSANHRRDVLRIIDAELVPALGRRSMAELVREDHIEKLLQEIEARGALTFARDVRMYFRAIWRHYNQSRRKRKLEPLADPSVDIAIKDAPTVKHHAALPASEVGEFLRALGNSDALPVTRLAVRFLLLTAVRTTELRLAQWDEIDHKAKLWRLPAARMKMKREHLVPLAPATLALLDDLHRLTGGGVLLFPSPANPELPLSDMGMLAAIYRMGYRGRMTGHGARSMFSTWCNEQEADGKPLFHGDAIERQLAHGPRDRVRAAYNAAEYLPMRRRMMLAWSEFLLTAERTAKVVPLRAVS